MTDNQTKISMIALSVSALIRISPLYRDTPLSRTSTMYNLLIIFIIFFNIFKVNTYLICDKCVCRNDKSDQDIHGEDVDCSYIPSILKMNYSLPINVLSMDLSSNNLTRIQPSNLLQSKTMVKLYLNSNALTEIEANVLLLPELKILDLSENKLEVIHEDTFKNVKKLEYLNLANNKFTNFDKLTFHHLSNLNTLIIDNNNIGPVLRDTNIFDRTDFGLTHKIKTLSISGINLNKVHENFFSDAYDIKKVVISNNNLTDIFEIPYTLQYLDLSDNPIKEIALEDFIDLPALKELKLNNLQIREVPDYVFAPLRGLINLELERNKNLTQFSHLAFGQEVLEDPDEFLLEKLSLKGSRLTTLDEQLLEPLGQLLKLDLQGNPWKCNCELVWVKQLQIQKKDYDHLRCATPKPLFNSRIFDLDAKYFACSEDKHFVGVTISVIAFCIVLTTIALWLFIFLPKYQSRCNFIQSMYVPSTAYTVLPLSSERSAFA